MAPVTSHTLTFIPATARAVPEPEGDELAAGDVAAVDHLVVATGPGMAGVRRVPAAAAGPAPRPGSPLRRVAGRRTPTSSPARRHPDWMAPPTLEPVVEGRRGGAGGRRGDRLYAVPAVHRLGGPTGRRRHARRLRERAAPVAGDDGPRATR